MDRPKAATQRQEIYIHHPLPSTIKPWTFRLLHGAPHAISYHVSGWKKGSHYWAWGPLDANFRELKLRQFPLFWSFWGKNNHKRAVNQFPSIPNEACNIHVWSCLYIHRAKEILILTFTSVLMAVKRNFRKCEGCHRIHRIHTPVFQWISIFGTQSLSSCCQVTICISLLQGTNWMSHWHLGNRDVQTFRSLLSHTKLY